MRIKSLLWSIIDVHAHISLETTNVDFHNRKLAY